MDKKPNNVEKKLWSTVKANIIGLENEKAEIEKELKDLEKYAIRYENKISSEIESLEKLSEKVESMKADPGFGWLNWLFSQTKTTRVRDSGLKAEIARLKGQRG